MAGDGFLADLATVPWPCPILQPELQIASIQQHRDGSNARVESLKAKTAE